MVDFLREKTLMQKKSESFFATRLQEGTEAGELNPAGENYLLANIPPESVVTNAYIHVIGESSAGISATAALGTTEGGSDILSAADLTTAGEAGTFAGQLETGTGKQLWLGITVDTPAAASGDYVIVVEYLEYAKKSGEYTRV